MNKCPLCKGNKEIIERKARQMGYTFAPNENLDSLEESVISCPLCQGKENKMKAIVKEIQIAGGHISHDLIDACEELIDVNEHYDAPLKLHFTIVLPNKEIKSITIRQEGDEIVAYGDFDGLPDFLEYAEGVVIGG